jgi:hypothetical protein
MAMKQPQKKVYRSMQGKTVDMDMLRQRNELTPAVGNARVNARGDELGTGGQIVRKREDLVKEYYETAQGVPDESPVRKKTVVDEEPVKKTTTTKKTTTKQETNEDPAIVDVSDDEWVEDADGNFVKKGE